MALDVDAGSAAPIAPPDTSEPAVQVRPSRWSRIWAHRPDIAGALLSCVGLLIVFVPVLVGGKTLSSASYTFTTNGYSPFVGQQTVGVFARDRLDVSASALQLEPWAEVIASEIWDGKVPLWNPYQAAGAPLAANLVSGVFDPLQAVVNIHPTPRTWDLMIVGTFFLAALSTYAFCRVLGMGYLAGITGATAFSLSGYFVLYSNNSFIRTYSYLPILCLMVELVIRSKRFWPVPTLGLAVFGCVAVGMPEIAFFVLLVPMLYALWRTFWGPRARSRAWSLGAAAGAFAFGLMLAAPALLLFHQYERVSYNTHKGGAAGIGTYAEPGRFLLNWFVPFFNGQPLDATSTPGTMSGTRSWIGGAVLALAVVGIASGTRAARLVVPFFGAVTVVLLAKCYGWGGINWIGRLPVVERINIPAWGSPVAGFTIAILAASGVDGIRRQAVRRWALVVALAVSGVALYLLLRANQVTLSAIPGDQIVRQLGVALAVVVAVVVVALAFRPRIGAYVVAGLVLVELVVLAPSSFAERADPFRPAPEWVSALQAELASQPYERVMGLDGQLYPDTAAAYELHDIRMIDPLNIGRYFDYVKTFISPEIFDRYVGGASLGSHEGASAYRDNPMFDLLGVRYLVAKRDLRLTDLNELLGSVERTDLLYVHPVTVGGETREAIFQHAPNETPLALSSPFEGQVRFDYGVADEFLLDPVADGVTFSVVATHRSGTQETLWQGLYDPGGPEDPTGAGWRTGMVDVPASDDPVVELALKTDARSNGSTDWSAWSDIHVDDANVAPGATFSPELVADIDGTFIFENPNATPRAFLVHDVTTVPDVDAAKASLAAAGDRFSNGAVRVTDIDVTREAVVEATPEEIPASLRRGDDCPADGTADQVQITKYEADRVALEVTSSCDALLVLSDTYFPGWQAKVDGKSVEIHPTDMALRGIVVGPGTSEVVFSYRPANFRAGIILAVVAVLAMSAVGVAVGLSRRRTSASEAS